MVFPVLDEEKRNVYKQRKEPAKNERIVILPKVQNDYYQFVSQSRTTDTICDPSFVNSSVTEIYVSRLKNPCFVKTEDRFLFSKIVKLLLASSSYKVQQIHCLGAERKLMSINFDSVKSTTNFNITYSPNNYIAVAF